MSDVLSAVLGPPAAKASDGEHRVVDPAATVERVRPLLRRAGITRIADVTGLDHVGIPVIQVIRPNARSLSVAQGKGLTVAAATASGVMESLELHHAETIDVPLRLAAYADLVERHAVVDPLALPLLQGEAFRPDRPTLWIDGVDLARGTPVLVPYEVVDLDARAGDRASAGCFAVSSNGLASGNTPAEAVLHGVLEVIERDGTALWNASSEPEQSASRIDLTSVDDPGCRGLLDRCAAAGLTAIAWDQTQDIGVPVVECMLAEAGAPDERLMYTATGMGCHTTREVALRRAITEAAQSRLTLIAGSRDDVFASDYEFDGAGAAQVRRTLQQAAATPAPRTFDELPSHPGATSHDDLTWCLERLAACGLDQVVAIDLSQEAFGIAVFRVVVPGLEGCHTLPGIARGRRAEQRCAGLAIA